MRARGDYGVEVRPVWVGCHCAGGSLGCVWILVGRDAGGIYWDCSLFGLWWRRRDWVVEVFMWSQS